MASVTQFTAEQAMRLLDFSGKVDMTLLDAVVNCFYNTVGPQQQVAQQVLTQFREHPEAWTQVDNILELSQNQETKVDLPQGHDVLHYCNVDLYADILLCVQWNPSFRMTLK
jgi:hypothetical protein